MESEKNKEENMNFEECQKKISEMEDRINELSDKLYEVNKKLKETEAYKGHFISNITNEIINPFASIIALSENIQGLDDTGMDKARKMAGLINSEASHLDFQLANIFAAATVESGKESLNFNSVNMPDLVNSVITYFNRQIEDKEIQLHPVLEDNSEEKIGGKFITDPQKIELIVKNLLSNAVKFSYAGGKIELKLTIGDTGFEILIRDFGKGVPEEHRKRIYDRFKQVDERINSINSGHGLGLSIVKSYCTLLEGKLAMQFPDDGGTKVAVTVPLAVLPDQDDDLSDFIIDMGEKF